MDSYLCEKAVIQSYSGTFFFFYSQELNEVLYLSEVFASREKPSRRVLCGRACQH